MARLTETQRRRIREENVRRRANRRPLMTDSEAASFIGVTYNSSTWDSGYGGSHSPSSCDTSSSACGGGGCD